MDPKTTFAREQLCGHRRFPGNERRRNTERFFLCDPCRGYIMKTGCHYGGDSRVEAGSNTSTVTLRFVGADEKGSLKSETVKGGHESQGTRIRGRLRWRGPAAYTKDTPVLTSERAPHKNKTVTVKE
jgi:hypothetical protein